MSACASAFRAVTCDMCARRLLPNDYSRHLGGVAVQAVGGSVGRCRCLTIPAIATLPVPSAASAEEEGLR